MAEVVKELESHEFTDRLDPIFRHISAESHQPFDPEFFYQNWRVFMGRGIARTWEIPGTVLGAIYYPHIYTGERRAVIMFWFALPEVRGTGRPIKLLDAFENTAEGLHKSCAAYIALAPERLRKILSRRGYAMSEEIWSKV